MKNILENPIRLAGWVLVITIYLIYIPFVFLLGGIKSVMDFIIIGKVPFSKKGV